MLGMQRARIRSQPPQTGTVMTTETSRVLRKWLAWSESKLRWILGVFALLLVGMCLIFPVANWLGIAGTAPRKHDPGLVYSSLAQGDLTIEYAYRNFKECNSIRNEFAAKGLSSTECRSGDDLDSSANRSASHR